ncbi:L-threonylcarbamoyladenylate synthase [Blastomonas sp.]|uniref:L-threonylcarbamoyladenylate synthase n=1 Tax=Blastomonas sp. TaxID=1909299 RepID=UPI00391D7B31
MPASKPSDAQIVPASAEAVARAVTLLRAGRPVALPTETVYGLAADASRADAVAAIYRTKGRPDFNPLIVHVPDVAAARRLAIFDERAEKLAAAFWPGPLTLVLPLAEGADVAPAVTAGLPTIALRCPAHPVMRAVLKAGGMMLAAPSANRSGGISPTTAAHVAASLGDGVPLILDGGACSAGLESTIVALRNFSDRPSGWQLLRPGPIDPAAIAALLGEAPLPLTDHAIEAPGQLASHYAPSKPVRLDAVAAEAEEWLIGFGAVAGDDTLSPSGDLAEAAANLYAALHRADASSCQRIAVAPIPSGGMGEAINDRLKRAAA